MRKKIDEITATAVERVTRDRLRAMSEGQAIEVVCKDQYDMESQKNTAYRMGRISDCRFACTTDGLRLVITHCGPR